MVSVLSTFIQDEHGATAIEYALIASLISVVIITAITTVGTSLNVTFGSVSNGLAAN